MVGTPFQKPVFALKKWKTFIGSYRHLPRKIRGFSLRWRLTMHFFHARSNWQEGWQFTVNQFKHDYLANGE
jgi:hypothetical protein